jgi:hypothetical protein
MNNAIVYSVHTNFPKIDTLLQWREIRYSIDRLREFNTDIPVKIYMSPVGIASTIKMPVNMHNAEIIEFDADSYEGIYDRALARYVSHKWTSTFDALERFDLDNVLYVDGDTIWYDDPQRLFDKYSDKDTIYTKEDHFDVFIDFMKEKGEITVPPLNDGINMVSRKMLKDKDYIMSERLSRVLVWQSKYSGLHDDISGSGIQWASYQYAISEAMNDIGNPVIFFDPEDVLLATEMDGFKNVASSGAVVFHYLNYNAHLFLPFWYTIAVGSKILHDGVKGKVLKVDGPSSDPTLHLKDLDTGDMYTLKLMDLRTEQNMKPHREM